MSRFIPRGAVALPALLIALGTSAAVAVPAQAARSWSPPVQLPGSCGPPGAVTASPASLPAGGNWTRVNALAARGQAVNLAVNPAGAAIITWGTRFATLADSGTVLGGFAAPVTVGPPPPYPVGHTHVALNNTGQAALAWASGIANLAATRTAGGTWSTPAPLSATPDGPVDVAIDVAGTAIAAFKHPDAAGNPTLYASKRPAGATWGPPALLSVPGDATAGSRAVADTAGTFVVACADSTTFTANVLTSPPGGGFAPAATVPGVAAPR